MHQCNTLDTTVQWGHGNEDTMVDFKIIIFKGVNTLGMLQCTISLMHILAMMIWKQYHTYGCLPLQQ